MLTYQSLKKLSAVWSVLFVFMLAPAPVVLAQDVLSINQDSALFRGEELMLAGSYAAASEIFRQADGLDRIDGLIGASRALVMMGNYLEAENLVAEAIEGDAYADFPLLSTQLAEIKRMTGQSRAALDILQQAIGGNAEPPVRSLVQYGSLLKFTGQQEQSNQGERPHTPWLNLKEPSNSRGLG